jgi:hypothetical protein
VSDGDLIHDCPENDRRLLAAAAEWACIDGVATEQRRRRSAASSPAH